MGLYFVIIKLVGPIPGKKNALRRSKNGGMFRDTAIKKQIDALTWQAKLLWAGRPALDRPRISALFVVGYEGADMDNAWTCILDCLRAAGVLVNDNYKHGPAPQLLDWRPCGSGEPEGVIIEIAPNLTR